MTQQCHFWCIHPQRELTEGTEEIFARPCPQQHDPHQPKESSPMNVDGPCSYPISTPWNIIQPQKGMPDTCHHVDEPEDIMLTEIRQLHFLMIPLV